MLDENDLARIKTSPNLRNLSPANVGRMITSTAIRSIALRQVEPETLATDENRNELYRLARTMEALVVVRPERENVESAAFVSALAHKSLREHYGSTWLHPSISRDLVAPSIVASLLFSISGSIGDSLALAKSLVSEEVVDTPTALRHSIGLLLKGSLNELASQPFLRPSQTFLDLEAEANDLLLRRIDNIVREMAKRYSIEYLKTSWIWEYDRIQEELQKIISSCSSTFTIPSLNLENVPITATSGYNGPQHLATLLGLLSQSLEHRSALSTLPEMRAPTKPTDAMRRVLMKRPFLWPNHVSAIEKGLLTEGTSAVVTFPTGAGKSALMELKIASVLDCGLSAIVLVPTNALVSQTTESLNATFPNMVASTAEAKESDSQTIYIMTPEKYLLLRNEIHENKQIGILVFDEFHLVSSASPGDSRRSIDAMLCLLLYTQMEEQGVLLLLSAMVVNGDDIAEWISKVTKRPCLNLDDSWRPNRQLRGMIAYESNDLRTITDSLRKIRSNAPAESAPKAAKDIATALPYGIFAVQRVWSKDATDLVASQLLDQPVQLGLGKQRNPRNLWHFTANANVLAAAIALEAARNASKVIIFASTIPNAGSIASRLQDSSGSYTIESTGKDRKFIDELVIEFGSKNSLYLKYNDDYVFNDISIAHHGLLLDVERNLHESLYNRDPGIKILVATSTLAQGMNLPADFVIIAGDARYDPEAGDLARIEAHELLNAAGRAGRAGSSESGVVLLIPSRPIRFSENNIPKVTETIFERVFGSQDACLKVEDPFESILSVTHENFSSAQLAYVAGRITGQYQSTDFKSPVTVSAVLAILKQSLTAHLQNENEVSSNLQLVEEQLSALPDSDNQDKDISDAVREIASAKGVSPGLLSELYDVVGPRDPSMGVLQTVDRIRAALEQVSNAGDLLPPWAKRNLKHDSETDYLENISEQVAGIFSDTEWQALKGWMQGKPMSEIEIILNGNKTLKSNKYCLKSRRFILRKLQDFSFVLSLPVLLWKAEIEDIEDPVLNRFNLCVKEGFDMPEKVDYWIALGSKQMRVASHKGFEEFMHSGWNRT